MKTTSRKRAPKSLPPAVSDLVAEGGNILATDDAKTLTVTPAEVVGHSVTPSKKTRTAQAKPRTVTTR
jgi:hypothetical protein